MTRNDYYAPSIDLNIKTEEPEERFIWTSEKVEQYLDALDNGVKVKTGSPFYENNPLLRKGNLVFEYTEEELSEVRKCANDIVHFANHYCKVMTDRGLEIIKLRDYQIQMLRNYQEHRFSIVNAARQIGKCLTPDTVVNIKEGSSYRKVTLGELYYESLRKKGCLTVSEERLLDLYKSLESLPIKKKKYVLTDIQLLEEIENHDKNFLSEDNFLDKIQDTLDLDNVFIESDTGYERLLNIHKTKPYTVWNISTKEGKKLSGADTHILFREDFSEVFIKDLVIGDTIITKDGIETISKIEKSFNKISMYDVTVDHPNHRFYSNGILSHNTVVASIFVSWYVLFHVDRNALILANKGATTKEIIDKSKTLLENLPFFLKPGILKNDVMNMKFDNGCRIIGQSTTKKSAIGFTIHLLFMDEFAHINPSFIESFYENVYPTISSSKVSRVIITSTPNGFNKFFELFQAAMDKKNEYHPFQVDWWQVPGRDKAWMEKEILQLGSIEAFNRQYGNQFASSTTLLLSPSQVEKTKKAKIQFTHRDIPWLDDLEIKYDNLIWHPDYDIEFVNKNSNFIVFSVDLAEGDGGDASVINIFRIEPTPKELRKYTLSPSGISDFFRLKQIGIFRSNQTDTEDLAKILYILAYKVFEPDNTKIVLEWNSLGSDFKKKLETVFPKTNDFDEDLIVKFKHRIDARTRKFGLRLKRDNKTQMCVAFKKLYGQFRVEITEEDSVEELIRFGKMPDGSYKGQLGKDDIAMTCVNVSEFFKTVDFEDLVEEYFDFLDEREQANLEDILDTQEEKADKVNYDIYEALEGL